MCHQNGTKGYPSSRNRPKSRLLLEEICHSEEEAESCLKRQPRCEWFWAAECPGRFASLDASKPRGWTGNLDGLQYHSENKTRLDPKNLEWVWCFSDETFVKKGSSLSSDWTRNRRKCKLPGRKSLTAQTFLDLVWASVEDQQVFRPFWIPFRIEAQVWGSDRGAERARIRDHPVLAEWIYERLFETQGQESQLLQVFPEKSWDDQIAF